MTQRTGTERGLKGTETSQRERQKSAPDYRLRKYSDFFQLNQNFITQL